MSLHKDMLDAGLFPGLGQDLIQPRQVLACHCAGDAALHSNVLIRILLVEDVDRNEQDVLVLVSVGCVFILCAQRTGVRFAYGLIYAAQLFPPGVLG